MCGIAGAISLSRRPIPNLRKILELMGKLIAHRGPDGKGYWIDHANTTGFTHQRLSIIDLSHNASQPMHADENVITFNGEIYNYKELRNQLRSHWDFNTNSDTETILANYKVRGNRCVEQLRGMFAFALYDKRSDKLLLARDRFGIKPLYYTQSDDVFYFASEAKALLPFLSRVEADPDSLKEYLVLQYTLDEKTLFKDIKQLPPGQTLEITRGRISEHKYWDLHFDIDYDHSEHYFCRRLEELLADSVSLHCRSDVEIGSYLSGGVDSSLIHTLANRKGDHPKAFNGRFTEYPNYDESSYARTVTENTGGELYINDIVATDFLENIRNVIYYLDYPTAGPGAFAQYMLSSFTSEHVKVVLGGQGGDELFGGYARYTVAYLEQCLKAAIEGTYRNGNYVVTIESIIPNLGLLKEYKPMIKDFWSNGLFEAMDRRYFKLIDRSYDIISDISPDYMDKDAVFNRFSRIFNNPDNVSKYAYFDKMSHFDFKCFLPAILQVEDRMSMAHGLESRVPFLDHPLAEFSATIPADIKFKSGKMKHMLKHTYRTLLPSSVTDRRDKMGFPVPLNEWFRNALKNPIQDVLVSLIENKRPFLSNKIDKDAFISAPFSRKTWGLISLELWYQTFHDQQTWYRDQIKE